MNKRTATMVIGGLVIAVWACGNLAAADRVAVVKTPDTTQPRSTLYADNKPPLLPSPLTRLPFGAIKPRGWLRKQLEIEAAGFFGSLGEVAPYCRPQNNAWLSPQGVGDCFWEEAPYWLRGYSALGYVLDDPRIINEIRPWIENMFATQKEFGFGYFGSLPLLGAPVYPAVPAALLKTADGKPGLAGEYFKGENFESSVGKRVDPIIDFVWTEGPMSGLDRNAFSVRWTGFITVPTNGDYHFAVYSDDGAKLWINNEVVVDNWREQGAYTVSAPKPLRLEGRKAYPIKLEYFQKKEGSEVRLCWRMPGATYSPRNNTPDLMPNMNMLYAMRAYHEYTGDKRALEMMRRYFMWQLQVPDNKFFSGGWQYPRNGDNIDSVYWLYNRTGDTNLLALAAKLQRTGHTWMQIAKQEHNVNFSQGFRKPALFYQQNNDPAFLDASVKNWESIMGIYGQVPGGMFGGDEFARPGQTDPRQAIETCGIVEMMHSDQVMLQVTGDAVWADRCENAAFNSLPAALTADMKALRYLTSPNQCNSDSRSKAPGLANSGPMQVMDPRSHRCCQHNFAYGWPFFAQSLWYATPGNGLAAMFYGSSVVTAQVGRGVTVAITEETKYPFDGNVTMTLSPAKAVQFPLYLRIPGWCKGAQIAISGKKLAVQPTPGMYVVIDRTWSKGDTVVLQMPMDITTTVWTNNSSAVSVNRGPLTFSLKIGEEYKRCGGDDKWPAWEIIPTSSWNYALVYDPKQVAKSFQVVVKPWPTNDTVFTHEGAPIEIRAQGRKLPQWTEDSLGLIGKLPQSPVQTSEKSEVITLIPMGAARLRISAFPAAGRTP